MRINTLIPHTAIAVIAFAAEASAAATQSSCRLFVADGPEKGRRRSTPRVIV